MNFPKTGIRTDYAGIAVEEPTVTLECSCKHCKDFATKQGLEFPMRFEIVERAAKERAPNAEGRHIQAKRAYQPPFGFYNQLQATFGPWKA